MKQDLAKLFHGYVGLLALFLHEGNEANFVGPDCLQLTHLHICREFTNYAAQVSNDCSGRCVVSPVHQVMLAPSQSIGTVRSSDLCCQKAAHHPWTAYKLASIARSLKAVPKSKLSRKGN